MLASLRSRLSFANVVSVIALFVALGGGAYALSTNSVKSRQIAKGAVKSSEIRDAKVKQRDLGGSSVGSNQVADRTITGADLADASIAARQVQQQTLDELETEAAFTELTGQPDLTAADEDIITATIPLEEPKVVIASGTIEAEDDVGAGPHRVGCVIEIAGAENADAFVETIPATATSDEAAVTVSFARSLPAGEHRVALRCRQLAGDLFVEDGWLSAWAVG